MGSEMCIRDSDICQLYLEGRVKESLELQIRALPLIRALFSEVNPIPVKKAVELMGLCGGTVRLPLTELEEKHTEELRKEMQKFGLISE